jgi:hypothetical protein
MSNHKTRVSKLERQKPAPRMGDLLTPRKVDYRTGITAPETNAPADSIPIRFVEVQSHDKP